MRFDLADLRLFVAVADAGSITKGARRASLSLGSASERIAAMEAELSNPETFVKLGAGTNDYIAKLDAKKHELEGKFARWAELEEIKAACGG